MDQKHSCSYNNFSDLSSDRAELYRSGRKTADTEYKAFNGFEAIGNAFDFMNLCASACKVELSQTRAEIEAMPNGMENLSIYTDNDIETFRDVLYYVGQVLGGFFVINRSGQLELKKYGNEPVLVVERKHRFTSSFSDFITRYTAVSSTNLRTQIAEYYTFVCPLYRLTRLVICSPQSPQNRSPAYRWEVFLPLADRQSVFRSC